MFCVNCGKQIDDEHDFCSKCGSKKVNSQNNVLPAKPKSLGSVTIVGIGFVLGFLTIVIVVGAMGSGSSNTEYVYMEPEPYYQDPYYDDDYYYEEPYYDDYYYYDGGY
tara:strand:+ start:295 stop:618 length:324 start_codon:yes stop_codon:yes gene_type:complete